jgi:hypothetical protein
LQDPSGRSWVPSADQQTLSSADRAPAGMLLPRPGVVKGGVTGADSWQGCGPLPTAGSRGTVRGREDAPHGEGLLRGGEDGAALSAMVLPQSLLDHLIGAQQQRLWDRQAEGLGGLEVDDQLELRRLLHG